MPTHRGFSAWIVSGGEVLKEHLVAVDSKSHRVQCWIPSDEGKTFAVYWRDHGGNVDSCAYIGLDGFMVPGRFLFGKGIAFREGVRSGSTTERPFMFSRLDETDADSNLETVNQDAGMITLKIKLVERYTHRPNNAVQKLPTRQRGKNTAGQLRIGYGEDKKTWAQCPTTWHFKPAHSFVTFIFRYRSHDFLLAQGIMSEDAAPEPSQDSCISDAPTSERSQGLLATPSPTPSPKTKKVGLERMSSSMKKAFYPGMAGLGRMRPAKDIARTVSSRASDQSIWQGLLSFNDPESGGDTIFATQNSLHREEHVREREVFETVEDQYQNSDHCGPRAGGGS